MKNKKVIESFNHLYIAKRMGHPIADYTIALFKLLHEYEFIQLQGVEEMGQVKNGFSEVARVIGCRFSLWMGIMAWNLEDNCVDKIPKFCSPMFMSATSVTTSFVSMLMAGWLVACDALQTLR